MIWWLWAGVAGIWFAQGRWAWGSASLIVSLATRLGMLAARRRLAEDERLAAAIENVIEKDAR